MSMLQSTLRTQKKALRKAIGATLRALPAASIDEQSQAVAAQIVSAPWFTRSKALSCYLSMPTGELSTESLVSTILNSKKLLFVPRIESADGRMDFVRLYGEDDLSSLPSGLWGIKEPGRQWMGNERTNGVTNYFVLGPVMDATCEPLDLILLPGVAFDKTLSRLGHGKGYYDRFIQTYVSSGHQRPLLVGLALREQCLESGEVPIGENDWKMDLVVTPDGIIGEKDC
ncbi:hypothetical protein AMATHDRAFT_40722 [Amanita thiersii Skay4041]|uniref:5-formyltetrahydrofolate cyclo-ligase n=1 Tax=Amanita thiersii Skay4041 TaxID=703135 RepID=A0A2A9NKM1_9AGAR|nr:hypothetical protein AMATHDRAFT_40722 [Amanita thiersii Skay4041]